MKYTADMHIHSTYSIDSSCRMEDHVKSAIDLGIKTICFTEHYDLNPCDEGLGFYDFQAISEEVKRLQDNYGFLVTILKGIEFSEPHLYPHEFEICTHYDYDYLLASIHFLGDFFVLDRKKSAMIPHEKLFEMYYQETLRAVSFGGFDALAHLDYLRRGTVNDLFDRDLLREIFSTMIKQNIALEINSQNIRRGIDHSFPTPEKVRLYAEAGGTRVVFGSDGHHKGDLGSGIEEAWNACSDIPSLIPGIFCNRQFITV